MFLFFKSYIFLCIIFVHGYIMCPENGIAQYFIERVISTTQNAINNPGQRHAFFFDETEMDGLSSDQIGKRVCDIQQKNFENDRRFFRIKNYIDQSNAAVIIVSEKLVR